MLKLNVGDIVTVNIESVAHGGHFIAKHNNKIIFVRHAITGEVAKIKITSVKSKLAFADAIEILKSSKHRVKSQCKYSKPDGCGGCDFQHISIMMQKKLKKDIIKEQFKKIAKIHVNPDIVSIEPFTGLNWRSRLNLAISNNGKTGFYSHKSNKIIEIEKCLIAVKEINKSEVFKKYWNNKERLTLTVSSENKLNISQLGNTISGSDEIKEVVQNNIYKISPNSFWQSHKNAPSLLIKKVIEFSKLKLGDIVCDLYGGVGLFSNPISKLIGEKGIIHLIERDNNCINDAKKNFKKEKNIIIHHGKVENKISKIKNIDIVILDPPRNGATKQVINQIVKKKPRSIIYVSCNPSSLARDTKILIGNSYSIDNIIGLDLFPMTQHIECIVSFKK